ncbi:FKBP-type peptidyl-prolyl cis-trans isomerase [Aestuariispira ectoiniformans]|uniref:FKBP-type peptidyl-prolyl cis-trans isomerase n=1 Tax=Aestuariispira ectoiniformans TaxID=2775080 RepID=UPI00223A9914|nr:FKBP-type peptidyl-prolyl cis-trans isomerase [Aestuariispira ectoiniformans]
MKIRFLLVGLWVLFLMPFTALAQDDGGLQIKDIKTGDGKVAQLHSSVKVHYTGYLMDGTKFDSSVDRNQPFNFILGVGQVIPGWDKGVQGMRVGGKRELIIPPQLAYGPRGAGDAIPPNATLRFEVELLDVSGPKYSNIDSAKAVELQSGGAKVVDIRTPDEWKKTGVIDGATLLQAFGRNGRILKDFPPSFEAAIAHGDDVIIVGSGDDQRAALLSLILVERAGYEKVYNLAGGVEEWSKGGHGLTVPQTDATTQ